MAHYARLNEHNIVEQVIVVANEDEPTEAAGVAFCQALFGGGVWKKTSYNGTIRKNFAGLGYYYDDLRDAFIAPRPYPSWQFNEELCCWQAPTPRPNDTDLWRWDEMSTSWVKMS
jgi:hypothetical protein